MELASNVGSWLADLTLNPIDILDGGHRSDVYLCDSAAGDNMALHIPHKPIYSNKYRNWATLNLHAEKNLPGRVASPIFTLEENTEVVAFVSPFICGDPLADNADRKPGETDLEVLQHNLIDLLCGLHTADFPVFFDTLPGPYYRLWSDYVEQRFLAHQELCHRGMYDFVDTKQLRETARQAVRHLRQLDAHITPTIVHRDIYGPNLIQKNNGGLALIDFEHAKVHDAVSDFVKIERWLCPQVGLDFHSLARTYHAKVPDNAVGFQQRLAVATIFEALSGYPYFKSVNSPLAANCPVMFNEAAAVLFDTADC